MADEASKFDIASLDFTQAQEDGIAVDIVHPKTMEPIGLKIWVAGPDSERQRKARRAVINERLQMRNQKVTAEILEVENISTLARATFKWEFGPDVTIDGKRPEWSAKECERLFTRFPFMFEQVNAAAGDRAGFIKG